MATFMFRHHKNCLPNIFIDYFCKNSAIHNYETRCADKLHISYARTDVMKFQYGYMARNCGIPLIQQLFVNLVIGILLKNCIKNIYCRIHLMTDYILIL